MVRLLLVTFLTFSSNNLLPNELKVGFAKISITPDLIDKWEDIDNDAQFNSNIDLWTDVNGNGQFDAVWMAGFQNIRPAQGIKDELMAVTAVIDDGKAPFTMKMVGITLGGKEITEYAPEFWLIGDTDGNDMGYVTSPWWSPELETNIALAWVPWSSSEIGSKLLVRLTDEYSV